MHADRIHLAPRAIHHHVHEMIVVTVRAAGDLEHGIVVRRHDKGRIAPVQIGRIFGAHVAPAAPAFVADPEIFDAPGRIAPVGPALGCERTLGRGHIFDPLRHVARRHRSHVPGDIGFGTDRLGEVHEFVGSERIVLGHPAPVGVDPHRPSAFRADAVAPVIFVGEAAARPAHHRHLDMPQSRDHVVAITVGVGNG